jgi:drug/metabolite transporter (DMT)-like permease
MQADSKAENPAGISRRDNETTYVLLAILAVAFLATGGIFVKLSALPPINTGFYRVLFSVPLLWPLVRGKMGRLSRNDVALLFVAGLFLAADVALWNTSFSYTTVANANLLTNLTPFTVVPVSYFLFKERIPRLFLPGAFITIAGVFLLLGGKVSPVPQNYWGDFLAVCASFFYAGFLLIAYRLRDKLESSVIMFVSATGSLTGLFFASCAIEGMRMPQSLEELWPLLGLTLCLQVVGHNLLTHCQGKLSVNLSSVICLAQPAMAAVYSWLIFAERLSSVEMLGIVVVMLGVYIVKKQYDRAGKEACEDTGALRPELVAVSQSGVVSQSQSPRGF